MSTSAIGGSASSLAASGLSQATEAAGTRRGHHHKPPDLFNGQTVQVDGITISDPGQMFQQLQSLKESDPAKLKTVLADISKKFESAAADAGSDSFKSHMMNELSAKFAEASQSGDLTVLQPPRGPGGERRGASEAYGAAHLSQQSLQSLQSLLQDVLTASGGGQSLDAVVATLRKALEQTGAATADGGSTPATSAVQG